MTRDHILRSAEREVVEAAKSWGREAPWKGRALTAAEERLKTALFMLSRARTMTGDVPATDVLPDDVRRRDPRREDD